jgi:hypothetical protein
MEELRAELRAVRERAAKGFLPTEVMYSQAQLSDAGRRVDALISPSRPFDFFFYFLFFM